jgi:hypothetical protein
VCNKARSNFETCNQFSASDIDTAEEQRARGSKIVVKVRGAVNVIKKLRATTKKKAVKSQSISSKTTPSRLVNAAG